jgi:hypothetical protein
MLLEEAQETELAEETSRDGMVHVGRSRVPPWAMPVVGAGECSMALEPQLHEPFCPRARSLPLPPQNAAQPATQPLVQLLEGSLDLGLLEVRDPATDQWLEPLDRPPQAPTPPLPSQLSRTLSRNRLTDSGATRSFASA